MSNIIVDVANGHNLTHEGTLDSGSYGLAPYVAYNGSTNYSHRDASTPFKGLTGFTAGGWFRAGASDFLMGVWHNTTANRVWKLYTNGGFVALTVRDASTAYTVADVTAIGSGWFHVVGRYNPSTEIAIFVNGVKTTYTTSIPAALQNGASIFSIGMSTSSGDWLTGRASQCFFSNEVLADGYIATVYGLSRSLYV